MASDPRPRAGRVLLTDQRKKFEFLLGHRGDQRERSKTRTSRTTGGEPYVTNQLSLAEALNGSESKVSRIANGITPISSDWIDKLCTIFQIDPQHLRHSEFERFEVLYSSARSGWSKLLDHIRARAGRILTEPPTGWSREAAYKLPVLRSTSAITEIVFDTPYWCLFECPSLKGSDQNWHGRKVVLLNLDLRTDKLSNSNAWASATTETELSTFPANGLFSFPPSGQEMTAPLEDVGEHAFVCLAIAPGANDVLKLARRSQIPPGLDPLGKLLTLAVAKGDVGVGVARYRITAHMPRR